MRALLYLVLMALVLWAGTAIEDARAPQPAAHSAEEETAALPQSPELGATPAGGEATSVEPPPLVGAPPSSQSGTANIEYTEEYVELLEQAVHEHINVERARAELKLLKYDEDLATIAGAHSTDMAENDYFAHEDEKGCTSACRLDKAGYEWRWVGENLFLLRGTYRYTVDEAAAITVAGWMGSEGHRKNVLSKNFTYEGVGVVITDDSIYVTELLAQPR